jgi:hypothetical protein
MIFIFCAHTDLIILSIDNNKSSDAPPSYPFKRKYPHNNNPGQYNFSIRRKYGGTQEKK